VIEAVGGRRCRDVVVVVVAIVIVVVEVGVVAVVDVTGRSCGLHVQKSVQYK
jgi:hypothetical protein